MLHNEIPLLRIVVPLCAGIISVFLLEPGWIVILSVAAAGLALLIFSAFFNTYPVNYIFGPALAILLFACGQALFKYEMDHISILESRETIFYGHLTDFPKEKENSFMLPVKLECRIINSHPESVKGSIILYHRKDSITRSFLPGDRILFSCVPLAIENRGNPYEFNYKFYMEIRGTKYYSFTGNGDIKLLGSPLHRKPGFTALIVRDRIIRLFEDLGIRGDRLAVIAAVTLGEKDLLDPDQKENFIRAGVMHIMAVSGLHVGIINIFIFNILFFLRRKFNILRVVLTILSLLAFAFITGLTPSVMRATIMFSLLQTGILLKRHVNRINLVLASALILILVRPSVIFDTGFLLSYAAVLSIITFYRDLYLKINTKNWLTDKIWQSVAVTLVAQAGTLPLTIMLFNRFPTYFIITNIIVVPLAATLIITGCIVILTSPFIIIASRFAGLLDKITGITQLITAKSAALPFSTIDGIGLSTVECVLLILAISLSLYLLLNMKKSDIRYPVFVFMLFVSALTFKQIKTSFSNELIVYNTPGSSTIGIRTGKILNIYSDSHVIPYEVTRHCSSLGLKTEDIYLGNNPLFLEAGGYYVIVTDSVESWWFSQFSVSHLILTGKTPYTHGLKESANVKDLTVISTDTPEIPEYFSRNNSLPGTVTWNIRRLGAFRQKLKIKS